MSHQDLMWRALEGALGHEKTAAIRTRPLHEMVREKVAREHGIDVGPNMTLGDATGALAIGWRKKKASHRKVADGLAAYRKLTEGRTTKTASAPSVYPVNASTFQKISAAYKLRRLQDAATPAETQKLAALQAWVDADVVLSLDKEASLLSGLSKNPAFRNMGKGVAIGTGLAAPAYMVGSALSDKFTDDARDKALQTAAGVGAIGLTTYGLGKGINNMMEPGVKQASANELENFKTAIYVDALLQTLEPTEKVAEVRALNTTFTVDLLCRAHMKTAGAEFVGMDDPRTPIKYLAYNAMMSNRQGINGGTSATTALMGLDPEMLQKLMGDDLFAEVNKYAPLQPAQA